MEWDECTAMEIINMGNGSYYIRSKLGTVIDVTNGSIQTGTNIQMYTLNYSSAQKWTLKSTAVKAESIAEGTYTIQAAVNTNYVLDIAGGSTADGGNVQIYSKNNTLAQNFVVTSVGNGYYKIVCEEQEKYWMYQVVHLPMERMYNSINGMDRRRNAGDL